jgi:hypothetical protein
MKTALAILTGLGGLALSTVLLIFGHITATVFAVLVPSFLVSAFLIWRWDTITKLSYKDFSIAVSQVQQAKSDVFAKVDVVQSLTEHVAELTAWMVSTSGTMTDYHLVHMLVSRDHIIKMLEQAKTTPERVIDLLRPLNQMIDRDMRVDVWHRIGEQLADINRGRPHEQRTDPEPLRVVIVDTYNRTELLRLLQAAGVEISLIDPHLHEVDKFRLENNL